jgi:diguanylate cyclase (GGDEF)-like protein
VETDKTESETPRRNIAESQEKTHRSELIQQKLRDTNNKLDAQLGNFTRIHDYALMAMQAETSDDLFTAISEGVVDVFQLESSACFSVNGQDNVLILRSSCNLTLPESRVLLPEGWLTDIARSKGKRQEAVFESPVVSDIWASMGFAHVIFMPMSNNDKQIEFLFVGGISEEQRNFYEFSPREISSSFMVFSQLMNTIVNNSAVKEQVRELEDVAYLDTVTKVYNRHYGMKALNEWLSGGKTFIICFVDMDNLKYVNDKFGHAEGDAYIMCVVSILRDFAPEALVCRLGGDEFMLLVEEWSLHSAEDRLEMLRNRLVQYNSAPGSFYNHSMSYGVIDVTVGETREASDLLTIADEKMYAYKRAHKAQRQDSIN